MDILSEKFKKKELKQKLKKSAADDHRRKLEEVKCTVYSFLNASKSITKLKILYQSFNCSNH